MDSIAAVIQEMAPGIFCQARPADSVGKHVTEKVEAKFGSSIPSNVAIEQGYKLKKPVPDPEQCEYCGSPLYYIGIVSWSAIPTIFRWTDEPERCSCEKASAMWKERDAEVARLKSEEERTRNEDARRVRVAKVLGDSGIKQRFMSRTFENFIRNTPERKAAYKAARDYADNFGRHLAAGEGIYIEGSFGTGKTHLAAAIVLAVIDAEFKVILKTADDLFRDIKRTFDEDGSAEYIILEKYKTCDLLVIDDLGKEQATDWTTAMLYAIINDRYERQKPVIITTNFNESDLIAIESPRGIGEHRIRAILSRLHETTAMLSMAWQDWRT